MLISLSFKFLGKVHRISYLVKLFREADYGRNTRIKMLCEKYIQASKLMSTLSRYYKRF